MENYTIKDIIKATKGHLVKGDLNANVADISTDTRTIEKGDIFVALIGERFDGHDFVDQAIDKGAAGIVVSHEVDGIDKNKNLNVVMVNDTTQALGDIAKDYRKRFNIPIIGVTGSNGKTTTKDMIYEVLSSENKVLKSEGNFNNTIGLPLTLFRLSKTHEIAVVEMGINLPGEMARLVEIAQPNVAVITNISPTHLEFLGSVEGVAKEKGLLAKSASALIVNMDDPLVVKMADGKDKVISYGIENLADITAKNIELDQDGKPEFTVSFGGKQTRIKLPIVGKHNVYNGLRAISAGLLFDIDLDSIKKAVESYQPMSMRMQRMVVNDITIINDTYNSNPMSMKAAIDLLKSLKCDGKKVLVVGDMLELGEYSDRFHGEIGNYIGKSGSAEILITMGEKAVRIAESAINSRMKKDQVIVCQNNSEVAENLSKILKQGDIALIKGSRGMKMEQIVKAIEER
ncbi:TPA: UDP-N-acetylmuramoyl-tripeptide--D-alanyl-D-alanine ligase [bacterium]|nr:UDP-N-acetylmuramoyl-tripeptide--D-alanyl-D-alanine ligase [bacterium]